MKKERKLIPLASLELNTGQIEWLPKNPREWTQESIDNTAKSIEEDPGFLEDRPLLVVPFGDKFVIFCGNLRSEGANKLGMKTAPCVIYFPETEDDREAVLRRSLKDNGTLGKFDWDELANSPVWGKFPLADFGIPVWSTEAQAAGVGGAGDDDQRKAEEDNFDEDKDNIEVRCKKGDIWKLGGHRLMCGDSTDADCVAKLMDGEKADISFTSPPYNAGDSEKLSGNTHFEESKYKHYDDNNEDYVGLITKSTKAALDNAKYVFVNLQPLAGNKVAIVDYLSICKNNLCDILIWRKMTAQPAMAHRVCNSQFEFVFVFSKENNSRAIGTRDFRGTESNVFDCSPQRKNEYASEHAATFSVEFVAHYIETFSNDGDFVLDLFGGTGTTMIAAEQLGRNCYMMEIDPHYCDVIIARWEKVTGKVAQKLN